MRKQLITVYLSSIVIKFIGVYIFNTYTDYQLNGDPWFELTAKEIIEEGSTKVKWGGTNADLATDLNLQKGTYYNWRPLGYSLFLAPFYSINSNPLLLRTIGQILIYSVIPVFIFLLIIRIFVNNIYKNKIALIASIAWCFYPHFWVSSLQIIDTWLITLVTVFSVYYSITFYHSLTKNHFGILLIILVFVFFLRPLLIFPIVLVVLSIIILQLEGRMLMKYTTGVILLLLLVIGSWTLRNYYVFGEFSFTQSNVGYNLWLGNNEQTNQYLRERLGDGAAIEDEILPKYNTKYLFLKNYTEYEKNNFFINKAIGFIVSNPLETIENIGWKFIGFWNPLRMRQDHWTQSSIKRVVDLLANLPFLILTLLSLKNYILLKEYKTKVWKSILISFIFFYIIPYLLVFSTARYRIPINFVLLILSLDYILDRPFFRKKLNLSG